MKRVNKVLLFFIALMTLSIWGLFQFVQSDYVGERVSKRIQKILSKKTDFQVSFKNIDLGFFPPRTSFNDVTLSGPEKGLNQINFSRLDVFFGVIDLFSQKLSIGKIRLNEAFLNLDKQKILQKSKSQKNKKTVSLEIKDIVEKYMEVRKKLPINIRSLELNKIKVYYDNDEVQINDFEVSFHLSKIDISGDFYINTKKTRKYLFEDISHLSFYSTIVKDQIEIDRLSFINGINQMVVSGNYKSADEFHLDSIQAELTLDSFVPLIEKKLKTTGTIPNGSFSAKGLLRKEKGKQLEGEFIASGKSVKADYYNFKTLEAYIDISKGNLVIKKMLGETKRGELKLNAPATLLFLPTGKYLAPELDISLHHVPSSEILFFLSVFKNLGFDLNGDTKLQFLDDYILIKPKESFRLKDFILKSSDRKTILSQKEIRLRTENRIVISYEGRVDIDGRLSFQNSDLNTNVVIENKEVSASIFDSFINFQELGPIVGFSLVGAGPISGTVEGPLNQVLFDLEMKADNFGFLDFELGSVESQFQVELSEKNNIHINSLIGKKEDISYTTTGDLYFYGDENLNLQIKMNSSKFKAFKKVAPKLFEGIEKYIYAVDFDFNGEALLKGGFGTGKMIVESNIHGDYFVFGQEIFDSFKSKINLKKNNLTFQDFELKKITGEIKADAQFNLTNGKMSYSAKAERMRLDEFQYYQSLNMGYSALFKASLKGGVDKQLENHFSLDTLESRVENTEVKNGNIVIDQYGEEYSFSSHMLGEDIKTNGFFDLNSKKLSRLNFQIHSGNLENVVRFFKEYNVTDSELDGVVDLELDTEFPYNNWEKMNLDFKLDNLSLKNRRIELSSITPVKIEIKNGVSKPWDIRWIGREFEFISRGHGELGKNFSIENKVHSDMSLAKIFDPKILRAYGPLSYVFTLNNDYKKYFSESKFKLNGADLQVQNVPGWLKNLQGEAFLKDNILTIPLITSDYGGGKAFLDGNIFLNELNEYNLNLKVEKSKVEFWDKSYVVASAQVKLSGKNYPYHLGGDVEVFYGEILEDMDTLTASALSTDSYTRFLPKGYLGGSATVIDLDLNVSTVSPVRVRNTLLDLSLGSDLSVFGSILSPESSGEVGIVGNNSKFLFKGHEFLLTEGKIILRDTRDLKKKPELKFRGSTKINNYDIVILVSGPTDNILLELNSTPPLSQEDILSLLTLGVTSDISKNLNDQEKQSLTGLSVGSLIVDQLKINQKLNDSLGVRLSVQPEFINQTDSSLLQGRTTEGTSTNQVRSATSVKVQKKLGKKANVSISSTLGGTVSQKQEMNLNYTIDPKWSVEGVYEIRSNDDFETQTQESAGADLKYIWSF